MSDFFEGLAARSSGAATALRPRTASAYETQAPDVVEIEEELTPATSTEDTPTVNVAPERPAIANRAEPIVVRDVVLPRAETPEAPSR
ncbi:MAG TPA: hypothetical protein VF147_16950, partial [Vicinamibacterales bacterium]